MQALPHLSDEQVARYRSGKLTPSELLDLDTHLASCEACRDLLYAGVRAGAQIAALRADLSGHLDHSGVVACASDSATPEQRGHMEWCADCRAEVEDLRSFQAEIRVTPITRGRRWRMPLTIAAGIAVAAVDFWSLRSGRPVERVQDAPLVSVEREALDQALAGHQLDRAPILDRLIRHQGTLLGPEAEARHFDLAGPLGTAVETDRPLFHWNALPGAASYVVAVYDENFENVATSPAVTGLEWQPAQALPRGRVFNWQVTARVGGESIHAPGPPAPEARFSVIPADTEAQIETARRTHPGNHLLLAAMYARAGDLDDAAHELDALDPAAAKPYRDSLQRMR